MTIELRQEGALIDGFKPGYFGCECSKKPDCGCPDTGDTPTPPGPEPPTPDTGITSIRIIVADTITDSGRASAVFTPATADTSLYYSSSDDSIAEIDPDTGEITVIQTGVVTFCVEDLYTGLEDCKEVNVIKSEDPDTGDTGYTECVIRAVYNVSSANTYIPILARTTNLIVKTESDEGVSLSGCRQLWSFQTTGLHTIYFTFTGTALPDHLFGEVSGSYVGKNPIVEIELPDCIREIGYSCFWYCFQLEKVVLPEHLEKIDTYGFYYCDKLEDIELPDTLQFLGRASLAHSQITGVTLPSSLTYVGPSAFYGCNLLETAEVLCDPTNAFLNDEDEDGVYTYGNPFRLTKSLSRFISNYATSDGKALITSNGWLVSFAENNIETYTIPSNVTYVGYDSFYCATTLTTVTIPNNVREVKDYAFYGCENMVTLNIGTGVTSIGTGAFGDLRNLDYINCYAVTAPELVSKGGFGDAGWGPQSTHKILRYPGGSDYSVWLNYRTGLPSSWTGQEITG